MRNCAHDLVELLLIVGESLALEDLGPFDAAAQVVQHEGDALGGVLEGDLGDQARRDRGPGRPQGRAAQLGIGQVIEGGVQRVAVLDLELAGAVAEPPLMGVVERLVLAGIRCAPASGGSGPTRG